MYSKAVITSHVFVPIREVPDLSEVRGELVAVSRFTGKRFKLFKIVNGWFGFPMYYFSHPLSNLAKIIVDNRMLGQEIEITFTSTLREGQDVVIERFRKLYNHNKTGYMLEAKPGSGKTVCAINFIAIIKRRSLIIVPRSNLVEQWIDRIVEHSSLKKNDVGYICGTKKSIGDEKKVVVGLVQSINAADLTKDFKKSFGCIIFDEVHSSVPPETFSPAATMFPARIRIGMSATLARSDGLDIIFRKHIGENLIVGRMCGRVKPKVLMHYFKKSSGYVHQKSPVINRKGMLLSRVASNPSRNVILVSYIMSFVKSGRRVVLLSDRIEQVKLIRELLLTKYALYLKGKDIGLYISSVRQKKNGNAEIERVARDCKVILATYGMFDLGTDIPDLAGLIYGTPCKEIEQKIGRIERLLDGKKQPAVVDLVDWHYPDARKWAAYREKFYTSSGMLVKKTL